MEILPAYGVPKKIVDPISIHYKDTVAQVTTLDGKIDFFEITAGLLQGDTVAPFFFIFHRIMHFESLPKIHRPVLCSKKDRVLENLQCTLLMQTLETILR